jgi:pimeloyl-ACP methyl ester carboxylesterase
MDAPVLDAFEEIGGPEVRALLQRRISRIERSIPQRHFGRSASPFTTRSLMTRMAGCVGSQMTRYQFISSRARASSLISRPTLSRIDCPTLVVAGGKDPRCPLLFSHMIADAIRPDLVRLAVFENCGHGPHVEGRHRRWRCFDSLSWRRRRPSPKFSLALS